MRLQTSIACLILMTASHSYAGGDSLIVNSMVEFKEAGGDCGCYFYLQDKPKDEGFILYWAFGDKQAEMKINGELTKLDILEEKLSFKLGQDATFKLKGAAVNVNGTCKVSGICPPESESCEVTDYKGSLYLNSSSQEVTIPIDGVCGC